MTFEELNQLFRSENALVRGENFADLITYTSQATRDGGLPKWESSSLAPKDGWMSYYGARDPQSLGIATVYDFNTSDQSAYWCYPSGHFAKLDHCKDSKGRPKNVLRPYSQPGDKTPYQLGLDHRQSHLRGYNHQSRARNSRPIYNEIYIKVGRPAGLLCYKDRATSRVLLYISAHAIAQATQAPLLPIALSTPHGLQAYTHAAFEQDLEQISQSIDSLSVVRCHAQLDPRTKTAIVQRIKGACSSAFYARLINRLAVDTDNPSSETLDQCTNEQRHTLLRLTINDNNLTLTRLHLSQFPQDIASIQIRGNNQDDAMTELLYVKKLMNESAVCRQLDAVDVRQFAPQASSCHTLFECQRRQKWQRFTQSCESKQGLELSQHCCRLLLSLNQSHYRLQAICSMLNLPFDLGLRNLKSIARSYLASTHAHRAQNNQYVHKDHQSMGV